MLTLRIIALLCLMALSGLATYCAQRLIQEVNYKAIRFMQPATLGGTCWV